MGLAFSTALKLGARVIDVTIPVPANDASAAFLIDQLDTQVQMAGWIKIGAYGGSGWEYLLESPQLLLCRCRIWKPASYGSAHAFAMQFASADGAREGLIYPIYSDSSIVSSFTELQAHIGCSQILTSRPDLAPANASSTYGWCVAGGIPYSVAPVMLSGGGCDPLGEVGTCSEMWWSVGDRQFGTPAACLRASYIMRSNYSVCYNGNLWHLPTTGFTGFLAGSLQIPYTLPAYLGGNFRDLPFNYWSGPICPGIVGWDATSPLYLDPLIAWGDTGSQYPIVRGQLWDAVMCTKRADYDEDLIWDLMRWRNYMFHGENQPFQRPMHIPSLYLLVSDQRGLFNYAH